MRWGWGWGVGEGRGVGKEGFYGVERAVQVHEWGGGAWCWCSEQVKRKVDC